MVVTRDGPSGSAIPLVSVVFPAALSPAMAIMMGRLLGGSGRTRCIRISLCGMSFLPPETDVSPVS
ncbi:hypothetical protein GCM10023317_48480 [Actinopolymorpha pittospori]